MSDQSVPPVPTPQQSAPPAGYDQPAPPPTQPAAAPGYSATQYGATPPFPTPEGGAPTLNPYAVQPGGIAQPQYGQLQYAQPQYGQAQYGAPDAWSSAQQGPHAGYGLSATPAGGMSSARKSGLIAMLVGFGIMLVGIVITVGTYLSSAHGGTYFVAWGAIIFGGIRGVIGLVRLIRG
ncbi:hypothetical protein [Schumannella soli]|uniref:Uncharacterized protein n=1 Tax=Schumannella soli TaxID=2590779 RepID=A0A506Y3S5_9MICO|nr:hypothetical protein [Schumannella soli]TPW76077.1 hypothetical protein FJ657_09670 [Schumannella soli]